MDDQRNMFKKFAKEQYANIVIPIKEIPTLVIMIGTTPQFVDKFNLLYIMLNTQIVQGGYKDKVVIKFICNNNSDKLKHVDLLDKSHDLRAPWVMKFEDKDLPLPNFIKSIMDAITEYPNADCISFPLEVYTSENPESKQIHKYSLSDGVTTSNPMRIEIAMQDNFQELVRTEVMIEEPILVRLDFDGNE